MYKTKFSYNYEEEKMKDKKVTIRLTTEERENLEKCAASLGIKMSELVREAIENIIKGGQYGNCTKSKDNKDAEGGK